MKFLHLSILIASCVICSTATGQDLKAKLTDTFLSLYARVCDLSRNRRSYGHRISMNFMKTMTTDAIESFI